MEKNEVWATLSPATHRWCQCVLMPGVMSAITVHMKCTYMYQRFFKFSENLYTKFAVLNTI